MSVVDGEAAFVGQGRARYFRERGGMIVLAPLILFVCLLIVMVLAGRLLYPAPRGPYHAEVRPQLHYAAAPATVYARGSPVRQLQPGDPLWMIRLDNGMVAVFADSAGRVLEGLTSALPTYRREPGPAIPAE